VDRSSRTVAVPSRLPAAILHMDGSLDTLQDASSRPTHAALQGEAAAAEPHAGANGTLVVVAAAGCCAAPLSAFAAAAPAPNELAVPLERRPPPAR